MNIIEYVKNIRPRKAEAYYFKLISEHEKRKRYYLEQADKTEDKATRYIYIVEAAAQEGFINGYRECLIFLNEYCTEETMDKFDYPTDKVTKNLFSLDTEQLEAGGCIRMTNKADKKSGKEVGAYFKLDLSKTGGLKLSRNITEYDKRIYLACDTLYKQYETNGEAVFNIRDVLRVLGNQNPAESQIRTAADSVIRLLNTGYCYDNSGEVGRYKKYKEYNFYSTVLPAEVLETESGGSSNIFIKMLTRPKLQIIAAERGQMVTFPLAALNLPFRSTDFTEKLNDYILQRVAEIKRGLNNTLNLQSLYKDLKIPTKYKDLSERRNAGVLRKRAKTYTKRYLVHLKETGVIADFWEVPTGFKIIP